MRKLLGVASIAAMTFGSGTPDDVVPSEPWLEATDYTYTVNSSCGEKSLVGIYGTVVENHAAANAVSLDSQPSRYSIRRDLPTRQHLISWWMSTAQLSMKTRTRLTSSKPHLMVIQR